MTIINLTPHTVTILAEDGSTIKEIPSSGIARCVTTRERAGEIEGVPINRTVFGEVEGLPAPSEGVYFVVSAITAKALKGVRDDLLITDDAVRDEQGRIVGCRALARA